MAPPSKLAIATSSVQRLMKEEASYHKELADQTSRISKLENGPSDENLEYQLRQEKQALSETETVLAGMKGRIESALAGLEEQLEESKEAGGDAETGEVLKARETIAQAKTALGTAA